MTQVPLSETTQFPLPEFDIDPFREQEEVFYNFSECYWIAGPKIIPGHSLIPILTMPGAELVPEDAFLKDSNLRLDVDISKRCLGQYTWWLVSTNESSKIVQRLTVDETGVTGSMIVKVPNSRQRDFAWELKKELIWAQDKIENRKLTSPPNPDGITEHGLNKNVLSYLMRTIKQLAVHPAAEQDGSIYLPFEQNVPYV